MIKSITITLIAITTFISCANSNKNLWHDSVNIKSQKGKDLIVDFEEISRDENTSLVRIKFTSGASVPSSMFIAKGFFNISKIRKKNYFINLKEWTEGEYRFIKAGFSDSNTININDVFGNDVKQNLKKDSFMSVKDFELIFKNKD